MKQSTQRPFAMMVPPGWEQLRVGDTVRKDDRRLDLDGQYWRDAAITGWTICVQGDADTTIRRQRTARLRAKALGR